MFAVMATGCKQGAVAPSYGTITVNPEPDSVNTPWRVDGTWGFARDGYGDSSLEDLPPGVYTITWGDVAGYETPASSTQMLAANESVTFDGLYNLRDVPFPVVADELMTRFGAVYADMDASGYAAILDSRFTTVLQQSTRDSFPDVGDTLGYIAELRIHQRMFSRQNVTDPNGQFIPAIQSVEVDTLQRVGEWSQSPANDPFPLAECAVYRVSLRMDRGAVMPTTVVSGQIKFYVTHHDVIVDGIARPSYQLLGQVDMTREQQVVTTPVRVAAVGGDKISHDTFGMYFDTNGFVNCLDEPVGSTFSLYMLLVNPLASVNGFECTVTSTGANHNILSTILPAGALDVDSSTGGFAVGVPGSFPSSPSGALVLCTWNILLGGSGPLEFRIGPASMPSMPGGRPVVTGDGVLRLCNVSSGQVSVPVLTVNGNCTVNEEFSSLGTLKCRFR
jgi:hypothetical protein